MSVFQMVFLGTGAADWDFHPEDEVRFDLEKRIRRTASLLLNGTILIDPGPESYFFAKNVLKLDLSGITTILLTHSHPDHFSWESLMGFLSEASGKVRFCCHKDTLPYLKPGAGEGGKCMVEETCTIEERRMLNEKFIYVPLEVGKRLMIGPVSVMPLGANHEVAGKEEMPLHYLLRSGERKFLYGCDGAWFLAKTWSYLMGKKLDLVILDSTVGDDASNYRIASHNTLPMIRMMVPAMRQNGVLRPRGTVVLSHLARGLHDEKEDSGNMLCAYDGMRLEL